MEGAKFLTALGQQLGMKSQSDMAAVLGLQQPQISAMKKRDVTPLVMARIVARLSKQTVQGSKFVPAIKKKLKTTKDSETAKILGITTAALSQWRTRESGITTAQICNAIVAARKQARADAHSTAYRPIIEMFPIVATKNAVNSVVFSDSNGANKQRAGLKAELLKTKGIYVFYDARGQALYVGQAAKQSIWKEMNHAYNRNRRAQMISLVKHPTNNVAYSSAYEKLRQPVDTIKKLVDIAAYFSAYEVDEGLIDDFEALFIRVFPNDLLNYKMEKPGKKKAK